MANALKSGLARIARILAKIAGALIALLLLQLKRPHIATADVASFLKAHPECSIHPVDGRPFRWKSETGELALNILGLHPKDQRFSVTLR